jgi:hypothetical protein
VNCKKDLDCYYNQIIKYLKDAKAVAVPLQHVRCGMQKSIWSLDPNLKTLKNKANFWLKVWNGWYRPPCGIVADLKHMMCSEYKKYLKSMCYCGTDFPVSKRQW